jgi:uncharacterized protein YndB with AHSA1/START domain
MCKPALADKRREELEIVMTSDRIEREITIAAPVERVWAVLTEPEHAGVWFGQGAPTQVDLRPGGIMVLDHGEYGVFQTRIEKVDPPHYFAYRWASGYPGEVATDTNSTLVEFTLAPDGDGTRLSLSESGFASLNIPAERERTAGYDSHSQGWPVKLEDLRKHAETH